METPKIIIVVVNSGTTLVFIFTIDNLLHIEI